MKVTAFLEKQLGPNWVPRLFGFIAVGCTGIVADPEILEFLPDKVEAFMIGCAKLVAFIAGAITVNSLKDAKVTGGTKPASREAKVRVEANDQLILKPEILSEQDIERTPRSIISLEDDE